MQKFSILYLLIFAALLVGCGNSEKQEPTPTQPVADAKEELQQEVQEDNEALEKVIRESQEEEQQVEELAKDSQDESDKQMAELLAESRAEEKRVEAMTKEKTAVVGQEQPIKDGDMHVDNLIDESKNDDALALAAAQMDDNPEPAAGADGPVVLLYSVNDRVTKEEQAEVFAAIKKKWFSDREFVEYPAGSAHSKSDVNQFESVKKQYNGRTVFRAEVLRIYGEWEITVRVGKVEKFDEDYLEAPLDVWRIDHVQSAERLSKEIHYGKKLSF